VKKQHVKQKARPSPPRLMKSAIDQREIDRLVTAATVIYDRDRFRTVDECVMAARELIKTCEHVYSIDRDSWNARETEFLAELEKAKKLGPMTPSQAICYVVGDRNAKRARVTFEEWRGTMQDCGPDEETMVSALWLYPRAFNQGQPTAQLSHFALAPAAKMLLLLNEPPNRKLESLDTVASLRVHWLAKQQREKK
jgi:hypothetical protein